MSGLGDRLVLRLFRSRLWGWLQWRLPERAYGAAIDRLADAADRRWPATTKRGRR